jgi:hypothetical protein
MVTFYTMTRNAWAGKAKGKHRGLLSRCAEDVFKALVYLAGKFDRLFPSLKGLAYLARCCPASVSTALDQLEAFGIPPCRRVARATLTQKLQPSSSAAYAHLQRSALLVPAAHLRIGKKILDEIDAAIRLRDWGRKSA